MIDIAVFMVIPIIGTAFALYAAKYVDAPQWAVWLVSSLLISVILSYIIVICSYVLKQVAAQIKISK